MPQENKPLNKTGWEQFFANQSFRIDSRQDSLGLIMKIFNELFDRVKEDNKTLDLETVKKACYFAAGKTKVKGEIFNIKDPMNTSFYDPIGTF